MRIVALAPYLTEILEYVEFGDSIVGVGISDSMPNTKYPVVGSEGVSPERSQLSELISDNCTVDLQLLTQLKPDLILTDSKSLSEGGDKDELQRICEELSRTCGVQVKIAAYSPTTLASIFSMCESIGKVVGKDELGRKLSHRIKAQLMDWGDNFYPRIKNKRVTVFSSIAPLRIAGRWIPDLVKELSATSQHFVSGDQDKEVSWRDVATFRPDVIVIAPEGYSLEQSVKTLQYLEKVAEWESLPAVKRGEVIFASGDGLYKPGPTLMTGLAMLVSAIAGLESGYITVRDSFHRLRWVEMHRHRFKG